MHAPAMMTRIQGLMWSSSAAGIANIATPTPNQPIWVKLINAEGRKEPNVPKERCANRSRLSPVLLPI